MNKKKTLSVMKTAVVRKEKEKDRIDFDRLLNSCKYALRYRT